MTDGKLDFGDPASQRAGAGMSDIFWAQTYFRQSFGFIIYGIPEKFLNFSCLSFLTSSEDNNTSFRGRGKQPAKVIQTWCCSTNCYLKLLQQGEVGSVSEYFAVLDIVHLLII